MEDVVEGGAELADEEDNVDCGTGDVAVGTTDVKLLEDGSWTLVSVAPDDEADPPVMTLPVIGIGVLMVV